MAPDRLPGVLWWLLAVFVAVPLTAAAALVNPHVMPEPCLSCHTKVPDRAETEAGRYFLIKPGIDDTCKTCHECCRVGMLHREMNHPSDSAEWDRSRFQKPKSLPLHDGKITCNTCHLHRASASPTVHLLRKVRVGDRFGTDWSELCRDCHVGY